MYHLRYLQYQKLISYHQEREQGSFLNYYFDRFVKITGSYEDARKKMFDRFGDKWSTQYSEEQFLALKAKYTELK